MRLEKVKNLISEGKTQKAIDLLQEILKDKDTPLLNQTILLEGQFTDLQRKMQLGVQDASAELNRINFTLLSLCDDAANLENIGEDGPEKPLIEDTKSSGLMSNPLAIFGIIAVLGIAVVLGIFALSGKSEKKQDTASLPTTQLDANQSPQTTPSVSNATEANWKANILTVNVLDKYYGNVKADFLSLKSVLQNNNTQTLTADVNFNCVKSVSGVCILNYLNFELVTADGRSFKPSSEVYFATNPKDGTMSNNKISFVVPQTMKQAILNVFYKDKKEKTLVAIQLNQIN